MFFDLDQDRMIDLDRITGIFRRKDMYAGVWKIIFERDSGGCYEVVFLDETDCALFWDSIPRFNDPLVRGNGEE